MAATRPAPSIPPMDPGAMNANQRALSEAGTDENLTPQQKEKRFFDQLTNNEMTYQSGLTSSLKEDFSKWMSQLTEEQRKAYLKKGWFLPNSLSAGLLREFFGDGFLGALLGSLINYGLQKSRISLARDLVLEAQKLAEEVGMEAVSGGSKKKFTAQTAAVDPNYKMGRDFDADEQEEINKFWEKLDQAAGPTESRFAVDSADPTKKTLKDQAPRPLTQREQKWVSAWREKAVAAFDPRLRAKGKGAKEPTASIKKFLRELESELERGHFKSTEFQGLVKAQQPGGDTEEQLKCRLLRTTLVDLGIADQYELERHQDLYTAVSVVELDSSEEQEKKDAIVRLNFDPFKAVSDFKAKAKEHGAIAPQDVKGALEFYKNSDLPIEIRYSAQCQILMAEAPQVDAGKASETVQVEKLEAQLQLYNSLLNENLALPLEDQFLIDPERLDQFVQIQAKKLVMMQADIAAIKAAEAAEAAEAADGSAPLKDGEKHKPEDHHLLTKAAQDETALGAKIDELRTFAQALKRQKCVNERQCLTLQHELVAQYNTLHKTAHVYPLTQEEATYLKNQGKDQLTQADQEALRVYLEKLPKSEVASDENLAVRRFVESLPPPKFSPKPGTPPIGGQAEAQAQAQAQAQAVQGFPGLRQG